MRFDTILLLFVIFFTTKLKNFKVSQEWYMFLTFILSDKTTNSFMSLTENNYNNILSNVANTQLMANML